MESADGSSPTALLGAPPQPQRRGKRSALVVLALLAGAVCLSVRGDAFLSIQGAVPSVGAALLQLSGAAPALPSVPMTASGGAAALARAPPPRMAEAAPKKAKKEKKKNPSPFGTEFGPSGPQPEAFEPGYSIFEKPKDFEPVQQWDKYAGGAAISPTRNFEGPSWERAYDRWAQDGVPRPSETQKLGTTPNFYQASNKAAREYDARRPDYNAGPPYRGKPSVTDNYKKLDVSKYKNLPPPTAVSPTPNKMGYVKGTGSQ